MQRGFYTAASGMIANRTRMDVITNNITNMDTIGYKKDTVVTNSFRDMYLERINDPSFLSARRNYIGNHNLGLFVDQMSTSFAPGAIEPTGEETDFAITGSAFFALSTPEGTRYTRAGNFAVDHNGYLVNHDGHLVLDTNSQAIQVGFDGFSVTSQGVVTVGGAQTAQMALVEFNDLAGLRKTGNNLFFHHFGEVPTQTAGASGVKQGAIEVSNVDLAAEAVEMITTNRAYEANSKAAQMIDDTLNKACNEIARF